MYTFILITIEIQQLTNKFQSLQQPTKRSLEANRELECSFTKVCDSHCRSSGRNCCAPGESVTSGTEEKPQKQTPVNTIH